VAALDARQTLIAEYLKLSLSQMRTTLIPFYNSLLVPKSKSEPDRRLKCIKSVNHEATATWLAERSIEFQYDVAKSQQQAGLTTISATTWTAHRVRRLNMRMLHASFGRDYSQWHARYQSSGSPHCVDAMRPSAVSDCPDFWCSNSRAS
jgi:hypothetical protein